MKTIINIPREEEKPEYPCLKKSNNGHIVLFTDKESGTLVKPGPSGYSSKIGHYSENWTEGDFKRLPEGTELIIIQD